MHLRHAARAHEAQRRGGVRGLRGDTGAADAQTGAALMPDMDPQLAALLKANPDRRPDEMYAAMHGTRGDVALPSQPHTDLKTMLLQRLMSVTKK